MPNNNPAGSSQPLRYHPQPVLFRKHLGHDNLLFDNMPSGETVIATTVDDAIQELSGFASTLFFADTTAASSDITDFKVYLKNQGKIYNLPVISPFIPVGVRFGGPLSHRPQFLIPGLYESYCLSYQGGTGARVALTSSISSTRDIAAHRVVISEGLRPYLLVETDDPGVTQTVATLKNFAGGPAIEIWNFDSVPHTFIFGLSDDGGSTGVPFPLDIFPIPAAIVPLVEADYSTFTPALPERTTIPPGLQLTVQMLEPIATPGATVEITAYTDYGNQLPVRSYQGGAY